MEELLSLIAARTTVGPDLEQAITDAFQVEQFAEGDMLLSEDRYCRKLYFIQSGMARTFHYHDGKDVSTWFYDRGHFLTSWYGFLKQQPSLESIEVVEDLQALTITFERYNQLVEGHLDFERFTRRLMEDQIAFLEYFYQGFMFLSAKEKYDQLLQHFPDITLRVKLGHIASFLGITQETLSRIRKQR